MGYSDTELLTRVFEIHNEVRAWPTLRGIEKARAVRRFEIGWLVRWQSGDSIVSICDEMSRIRLMVGPGVIVAGIERRARQLHQRPRYDEHGEFDIWRNAFLKRDHDMIALCSCRRTP